MNDGAFSEAALDAIAPPGTRITHDELMQRSGIDETTLSRRVRLLGLNERKLGDCGVDSSILAVFDLFTQAQSVLGEDAIDQLARLLGEVVARLADAVASTFVAHVANPAQHTEHTSSDIEVENLRYARLLPAFRDAFDALLRRHIVQAIRAPAPPQSPTARAIEIRTLAIAFIDMTQSSTLTLGPDLDALDATLERFELLATDTTNRHAGRVVKFIGDAAMISAPTLRDAISIAATILRLSHRCPDLPPLRSGISEGPVLVRNGDCFGRAVTTAARLADVAQPGQILIPSADLSATDDRPHATPAGTRTLRGFTHPLPVSTLSPLPGSGSNEPAATAR